MLHRFVYPLSLLSLLFIHSALSADTDTVSIQIESYLVLGPLPAPPPVLNEGSRHTVKPDELVAYDHIPVESLKPERGAAVHISGDLSLVWDDHSANDGRLEFETPRGRPVAYYAASYIRTDRWIKAEVTVDSDRPIAVYLNGECLGTQSGNKEFRSTAGLTQGSHLIVVKWLSDPENGSPGGIRAGLSLAGRFADATVRPALDPERFINISNVLDDPRPHNAYLSPDGEYAAVRISTPVGTSPDSESWIRIFRTRDGSPLRTFRGGLKVDNFAWAPDGRRFSYVERKDGKAALWIVDMETGEKRAILEDVERLGSYEWSPTGSFIVFAVQQEDEEDESFMRRISKPVERWHGWSTRSFLHLVQVPSGARQRLTAGDLSTNLQSISPDGNTILFTRTTHDFSERPFSFSELYSLDLRTMELDTIAVGPWSADASWSPDGNFILILGGPSFFGDAGIAVPDGTIPNEYDRQAYIFDTRTGTVEPISRGFYPSIISAHWSRAENAIYFNTVDRTFNHVYRYDLRRRAYEKLDLGVDIVRSIDFARDRAFAVYTGESATQPPRFYSADLTRKRFSTLYDPNGDVYRHIRMGQVEDWNFTNERGSVIEGRIYYPPDFDPSRSYPLIVYYYGGTTPVSRTFEGRYPTNLWAAHGYVVYVPQPSGTIGYGQEFSSLHVNDWGIIVADEIIDGVGKFLDAHPFVDRQRVAAIGASYGGFMTKLLLTKTDLFAAAVSHAGISMIPSYWGQGFWGFSYSAVATANSFPWNRRDIYVDQSPLFNADKITTPLLIVTGDEDTNVPAGESTQFFLALKLLGKEVAYVQVEGQNHQIIDRDKRVAWGNTIIAWFDKYLKGQPEWWNDMYGD